MTWGRYDSLAAKGRDLLMHNGADGTATGTAATYTPAEGSAFSVNVIFTYFVGALDVREQALIKVRASDVSAPNRGDYIVLDGDSTQWVVNDVREQPSIFELRCVATLERS